MYRVRVGRSLRTMAQQRDGETYAWRHPAARMLQRADIERVRQQTRPSQARPPKG